MHVEEPTLSVIMSVNDGPLAGTEGKHVTSNKIRERLEKEMEVAQLVQASFFPDDRIQSP